MRRVLAFIATGVLATGMAMAQTSSGTTADQGANNATSSADQKNADPKKPSNAGADQNADAARARSSNAEDNMKRATQNPNGQTGANGNQDNSSAAATGGRDEGKANADAARTDAADASNQASNRSDANPANDPNRRAVPWMWIALGIVALIVIFSLFGGGNRPRVEPTDRVTRIDRDRVNDMSDREGTRRDDDIRRVG